MKKIFLLFIVALSIASCVKMPKPDVIDPEKEGLEIPADFDWKTIKELDITVNVTAIDPLSNNKIHIIRIYNSPLANSASLMATGAAKPNSPFNIKLTVANPTEKIYIHETTPDGKGKMTEQAITSSDMVVNLATQWLQPLLVKSNAFLGANVMFPAPSVPIPTQYDQVINSNASVNIVGFNTGETSTYGNQYKSYIIPAGFNRTANINFGNWLNHAILYVEGSLTLNSSVSLNKCSIVILDGGSVSFKQLSTGSFTENIPVIFIEQGGTLSLSQSGNFTNGLTVVNKGTFNAVNTIDINMGSKLYNEGSIVVTKNNNSVAVSNNSSFYNSGTITSPKFDLTVNANGVNDVSGVITTGTWYQTNGTVFSNHGEVAATVKFSNSGGGTVYNHCHITAQETDVQALTAYLEPGSLWQTQTFKINNSTFTMAGGSIFLTASITSVWAMNFVSASEVWSLLKVTGNAPDLRYASSQISGKIEFVHSNLVEGDGTNGRDLYTSSLNNGAVLNKEQVNNITGTACNLSLGQITPTEPEPDPVFASYFPSQSGWATYAFEDLWPVKGDYDLNDMVLKFRVTQIANSSNMVLELTFDYQIVAIGATKQISAAFQLDNVLSSNIQVVEGDLVDGNSPFLTNTIGVEVGVSKAIIPVFNDPHTQVSFTRFLNTEVGNFIPTPEKQITVKFASPVNQSSITMSSFNFFITVDNRSKEIHLPGYISTEKFSTSSTEGGNLHTSDIYKNEDGMMWGLLFPESFAYPSEQNSIIDAYTHFATWATSGGTEYPDWYMDKTGYRDPELLY
ncbi:MAG: LruC domain-containing protein [Bacteroidales bacterium]